MMMMMMTTTTMMMTTTTTIIVIVMIILMEISCSFWCNIWGLSTTSGMNIQERQSWRVLHHASEASPSEAQQFQHSRSCGLAAERTWCGDGSLLKTPKRQVAWNSGIPLDTAWLVTPTFFTILYYATNHTDTTGILNGVKSQLLPWPRERRRSSPRRRMYFWSFETSPGQFENESNRHQCWGTRDAQDALLDCESDSF